jgi:predicted DNA-binding transcriptional regulator AlpA
MAIERRIPRLLRQADLEKLGISDSYQRTKHLEETQGFPRGRLLGPNTRVRTDDEILEWLDSRPVEVSEQTKQRVRRSIEARQTGGRPR